MGPVLLELSMVKLLSVVPSEKGDRERAAEETNARLQQTMRTLELDMSGVRAEASKRHATSPVVVAPPPEAISRPLFRRSARRGRTILRTWPAIGYGVWDLSHPPPDKVDIDRLRTMLEKMSKDTRDTITCHTPCSGD